MTTYRVRWRERAVLAALLLCFGVAGRLPARADELELIDPGTVIYGNFYSLANVLAEYDEPPLPVNPHPEVNLYLWSSGAPGGLPLYLYDDTAFNSHFLRRSSEEESELPPDPGGGNAEPDPGVPPSELQYWDLLGLSILQPVLLSSNSLSLTATNVQSGIVLDLLYTTNLALLPSPALCGTNWAWITRGAVDQITFSITNLPQQIYFRLGNALIDSDGDGLPDAYEMLVSHTDPNVFNVPTGDGYGTPDAWYILHGLNPATSGIGNDDPDTDGLVSRREYLWGSDPQTAEGLTVWVGNPAGFSSIP